MAQQKEYSDIVAEEAEKLKEALKKKKREEAAWDDAIGGIAGAVFGGPMLILLIMFVSLVSCTTLDVP